jgi:hypothetical protein
MEPFVPRLLWPFRLYRPHQAFGLVFNSYNALLRLGSRDGLTSTPVTSCTRSELKKGVRGVRGPGRRRSCG